MKCEITFFDTDEYGVVSMSTDFGDAESDTGGITLTPATISTIGASALFKTSIFAAAGTIMTVMSQAGKQFDAAEVLMGLIENGELFKVASDMAAEMNAASEEAEQG